MERLSKAWAQDLSKDKASPDFVQETPPMIVQNAVYVAYLEITALIEDLSVSTLKENQWMLS
jgi:hypothetical protein